MRAIKGKIESDFESVMKIYVGPSMPMPDSFGLYFQSSSSDDTSEEVTEILNRDTSLDRDVNALTDDSAIARDPNQATDRCDQFVY
jgi:hypothetical protein